MPFLSRAISNFVIPPWVKFAVPALLAALLAIQTARMHSAHVERDQARIALSDQAERIKLVSAQAIELATQAKANAEANNRRLNDETDHQATAVNVVYRDRVLRLPSANTSCSGKADLPATDATKGADGSRSDPIIIEREDALICATNTSRLQAAHDWAVGMGNN